jgi:aspartyl-tRNA synthetase
MSYAEAMATYGSDKPDIRFEMKFTDLKALSAGKNFQVFDNAEAVIGIAVPGASEYTRKQLDEITDWVKRPQIGALGLVYVKCNTDGTYKSSVDKFYDEAALKSWAEAAGAKAGDLIFVLSGDLDKTRKQMNCVYAWVQNLACASRMNLSRYGYWISRSWNGMKKMAVTTPCTIRLLLRNRKISI